MAGSAVAEVEGWAHEFDALAERVAPRFGRREPRRRARAYLKGLLAPVERKNGWQPAEVAGDRTPDGVQDFLSRMRWDAAAVCPDLRADVVEHLGDSGAVLVLDETGFVKKGRHSVGVPRQYSGTAGRIGDGQIGVFLGDAGRHGHTLIDRALDLPEGWTKDRARRAAAGVAEAAPSPPSRSSAGRCWTARSMPACPAPGSRVTASTARTRPCAAPSSDTGAATSWR